MIWGYPYFRKPPKVGNIILTARITSSWAICDGELSSLPRPLVKKMTSRHQGDAALPEILLSVFYIPFCWWNHTILTDTFFCTSKVSHPFTPLIKLLLVVNASGMNPLVRAHLLGLQAVTQLVIAGEVEAFCSSLAKIHGVAGSGPEWPEQSFWVSTGIGEWEELQKNWCEETKMEISSESSASETLRFWPKEQEFFYHIEGLN